MPQAWIITVPNNISSTRVILDLEEAQAFWLRRALSTIVGQEKTAMLDLLDNHGLIRYRNAVSKLYDLIVECQSLAVDLWRAAKLAVERLQREGDFDSSYHVMWMAFIESGAVRNFPNMHSQTLLREDFEPFCIRCGEFLSESGMIELTARWQAEQAIRRGERER
jgi:hypothetical protein